VPFDFQSVSGVIPGGADVVSDYCCCLTH